MTTFGVGTADPRYTLEIIAAGTKPLADLLDTLKALHAVGSCVFRIVLLAAVGEMPLKDRVELVSAARYVPFGRDRFRESCGAHMHL